MGPKDFEIIKKFKSFVSQRVGVHELKVCWRGRGDPQMNHPHVLIVVHSLDHSSRKVYQ